MFNKKEESLAEKQWIAGLIQSQQNMKFLELAKLINQKIDKLAEACDLEWEEAGFVKKKSNKYNEIKQGDTLRLICGAETEDIKFGEITLHTNGLKYKFKPAKE